MTSFFVAVTVAAALAAHADTVFEVSPGARLWLRNLPGSVSVETWGKDAVRLQTSGAAKSRVRIEQRGPSLFIESRRPGRGSEPGHYMITVPRWMPVAVVSPDASAHVKGLQGDLIVRTVNGEVNVTDNDGSVSVSSVQGSVRVARARGRLDVNTVNGLIRLDDVSGRVYAETVNGAIELARVISDSVEASTVNGGVRFDGNFLNGGWYRFATHRGDIAVDVGKTPGAVVYVSTYAGEFESDFPVLTPYAKRGRALRFKLGDGSAKLQLESFLGRIRLLKDNKGHKTPAPLFEWSGSFTTDDHDHDHDSEEDKE